MDSRVPPYVHAPSEDADDEVSLGRIFSVLWSYRRVIQLGLVLVAGAYAAVALAGYLVLPRERIASVGFRLVFDGVDKGEYPNGTKFSTAEIVAGPVLSPVFAANDLQRYFGSFEAFKNSVFVRDANRDLQMLDLEYESRLADPKLAVVDRNRLETEYREKRRSLTAPIHAVSLRRDEWLMSMPRAMQEKVLKDVLATWAQQAEGRKGALRYNISMYSRATLERGLNPNQSYLVSADLFRVQALAMLDSLDNIAELPGALALRAGEERLSLAEIRANVNDILRFKLQPLVAMIRQTGTMDARQLRAYVDNQLLQLRIRQVANQNRTRTLQDSLRQYSGDRSMPLQGAGQLADGSGAQPGQQVIPQVGESFLDRLIELSKADTDTLYRQDLTDRIIEEGLRGSAIASEIAYYEDLDRQLPVAGVTMIAGSENTALKEVFDGLGKAFDQANAFYAELSAQNLNPETGLYAIAEPFSTISQHALSLTSVLMYGALILLLSLFVIPIGCLVHKSLQRSRSRRPDSEPAAFA